MVRDRGMRVWVWTLAGALAWVVGCGLGSSAKQSGSDGQALPVDSTSGPATSTGTTPAPGDANQALGAGGNAGVDPAGNAQAGNEAAGSPNVPAGGAAVATDETIDLRYPVAYVGRFDLRDPNRVRFNFPGSKIGVAFTGTSLGVRLTDSGADTFDVVIDGVDYASSGNAFAYEPAAVPQACQPVAKVPAWDGNNFPGCILAVPSSNANVPTTYPIATDLADGNHVAWITKRSEFLQGSTATGYSGTATLWGFVLADGAKLLPPPAYKTRRIEVVGDSSTSGFGAGQRNPCGYSPRNCDAGRDVPSYLAQYLHAERVNVSSSGQAVYRSYYDYNLAHNLPVIWRQTVGLDTSLPWDFNDRVDVVVLSAGGDDLWGAAGSGAFSNNDSSVTTDPRANFVAAYVSWLGSVRALRPQATIYATLTYGAAGNDVVTLGSALQEAVATRNASGDANVVYFTYFPANDPVRNPKHYVSLSDAVPGENLWYGCTGHPAPVTARYLAGLLGTVVAKRMGWTDVGY